jgi:hypothetical protein
MMMIMSMFPFPEEGSFREASGKLQGSFREDSGKIQGRLRELQGRFTTAVHSMSIYWAEMMIISPFGPLRMRDIETYNRVRPLQKSLSWQWTADRAGSHH